MAIPTPESESSQAPTRGLSALLPPKCSPDSGPKVDVNIINRLSHAVLTDYLRLPTAKANGRIARHMFRKINAFWEIPELMR